MGLRYEYRNLPTHLGLWTQVARNDAVFVVISIWLRHEKSFTKVLTSSKRAFSFSLFFSKSDFKKVHWRKWVTGGGRRAWTEVHRRKLSPMIGDPVFRNLKLLYRRGNELLSRVLIWKKICRRKLSIFPSPLDSPTRSLYLSSSFIQFFCVHFLDFRDLLSWSWVLGYER